MVSAATATVQASPTASDNLSLCADFRCHRPSISDYLFLNYFLNGAKRGRGVPSQKSAVAIGGFCNTGSCGFPVNHLDYLGVQVEWVAGPWFLSIFMNMLPWESVLRVWDVLLFQGNRVMLFRTALSLMELYVLCRITTKDAGDAVTLLQSLAGSTFDSSQLVLTVEVDDTSAKFDMHLKVNRGGKEEKFKV